MRTSLIGKPKNWLDGQYRGVKPYENLEIIKKEDFIPEAPVRIISKKQIAEDISSMLEAIELKGKSTWFTVHGAYEVDCNYNPPRVTKLKEEK